MDGWEEGKGLGMEYPQSMNEKEPLQRTPQGAEIPIPKRDDLTSDDARMIAVEQRTAAGRCCAIEHCPLLPQFRVHLVAMADARWLEGLPLSAIRSQSFSTPHRMCSVHEAAIARHVELLTVDEVARPAEQAMVIAAARQECGWPADAAVILRIAVRSA